MLFPTVNWPMTSALAANLAYLYMLPLCTFFSSLYHNVVIQSTLLQHCDTLSLLFYKVIDAVSSKVSILATVMLSVAVLVSTFNVSVSSFSSY